MLHYALALIWILARVAFIKSAVSDTEMGLYVNKLVPYGEQVSVVVTLSELPKYKLTLRVMTPVYLVGYWIASPRSEAMQPLFIHTANIMKELRRLNIQPSEPIKQVDVYFAVLNATFWQKSTNNITLTGFTGNLLPMLEEKTVEFRVKWPLTCLPQLHAVYGQSPDKPLVVLLDRAVLIAVEVDESCGLSTMNLTWILMDVLETKQLEHLGNKRFQYYVKPYTLRYSAEHELWRNLFIMRIYGRFKNRKYLTRSYLKVNKEDVRAQIDGGLVRYLPVNQKIYFDGMQSRDFARSPREHQFVKYNWTCKSISDPFNKYCWKRNWKAGRFSLPPYSLKPDKKYMFSLKVVSDFNPNIIARAYQKVYCVSPSKDELLSVTILCAENCENGYYNPASNVVLLAKCTNAKSYSVHYSWYMDRIKAGEDSQLNVNMQTNSKNVLISVMVHTTDERKALARINLLRADAPWDGDCVVYPTEGIEATTPFFVCCQNFKTLHGPLQYFYYAGQVLLNDCMDCLCPVYLTREVNSIKVLICDHLLACTERKLRIKVNPLAVIDEEAFQDDIWEFITTSPNNFTNLVDKNGNLLLLSKLQWTASHIMEGPIALEFITILGVFQVESLIELSKLANLTSTFSSQLTPINSDGLVVLIHLIRKMNENFKRLGNKEMINFITKMPYLNITIACIKVYDIMHHLTKEILRPPQSLYDQYKKAIRNNYLNEIYIDELFNEISTYKNLEARERSTIWLNAMWETEQLFRYLHLARKLGILLDSGSTNAAGVSLQVKCIKFKPSEVTQIRTNDQMHVVTFSPELLHELKDPNHDEICIKVISTIRELNWWYPEEKQPSSVLLSVRIYTDIDDIPEARNLRNSEISFKTVIGKYKPAIEYPTLDLMYKGARSQLDSKGLDNIREASERDESGEGNLEEELASGDDDDEVESVAETGKYLNCLRYGELRTEKQVLIYRINLDEHSMVVVRFMSSTHKLRALLILNKLPKKLRETIARSQCIVPAHSTNATMLLRNNCMTLQRVYMAVQLYKDKDGGNQNLVLDTPAAFSFVFQVRTCDYWSYSKPEDSQCWEHQDCLPGLNNPEKGTMYCTCGKLGTYTSYVFHVPAILVPMASYVPVRVHWELCFCYLFILTVLFVMLIYLFMKHNKLFSKTITCDMAGLDRSDQEVHDLLIYIRTGGQDNAGTTATVRLIFQTQTRTELQFTLMQDPEKPELKRNSTYILALRTRDIRIPTRIAVSHNNFGRYPSWFLRRIDIVDIQAQLMQIFHVRRWVRYKYLVLSSALVIRPGDINISDTSWRGRFNNELERQWINWGLWQPLTGSWRSGAIYDNLTRAQRVCIFVNKMLVAFCVCACVIGKTTSETAYEDMKLAIDVSNLLIMAGISIILTNLVQFLFIKLINVKL